MRRPFSRLTLGAIALVVSATSLQAAHASSPPFGPVYPAPGGNGWTPSGSSIAAGGVTWSYSNFDFTAFSSLWWGLSDASSVQLSMDGNLSEAGATMTFDPTQSNLSTGSLVFTGSTSIPVFPSGTAPVTTRFIMQVSDVASDPQPLVDPASIDAPTVGGLYPVIGDYQVNMAFQAFDGVNWIAAQDFFKAQQKPPSADGELVSSINGGFFYIPPPSSLHAFPAVLDPDGPTVYLQLSALLTATKTGAPIAGRTVHFTSSDPAGGDLCDATTNGSGVASCSDPANVVHAVLGLGYEASYAGGSDYLSSQSHGSIARVAGMNLP